MRSFSPGILTAGAGLVLLLSLAGTVYLEQYWLTSIPFLLLFFFLGWHQPRWIFYILVFTLPFSTEVFFENGFSTDLPDEVLMWLMTALITFQLVRSVTLKLLNSSALRLRSGTSPQPVINPSTSIRDHRSTPQPHTTSFNILGLYLLIWISWIFFTTLVSGDPFLSIKYLLAKCWYVAAFVLPFLFWKDEAFARKAIQVLLIGILVATVLVLWQHGQTGFSFASVNSAVRPFFRNHVNYSAMLVCSLPMIYLLFIGKTSSALKRLLLLMGLLIIVALYFSYARGAWLALLAGGIAYILIRARLLIIAFISVFIVIIAGIAWLKEKERYLDLAPQLHTTVFHENFREHLVATYQLKDISTAERIHRWIAGVNLASAHPIGGIGPNRFYDEYKPYALPAFKTWVSDNPERSGVHNYYLLLAIEQGVPGLIFFLLLAGTMLFYSQRMYHRAGSETGRRMGMMLGMMVTMILVLNFLSDLIETDKIGSLFFMSLGLLSRCENKASNLLRFGHAHATRHVTRSLKD